MNLPVLDTSHKWDYIIFGFISLYTMFSKFIHEVRQCSFPEAQSFSVAHSGLELLESDDPPAE